MLTPLSERRVLQHPLYHVIPTAEVAPPGELWTPAVIATEWWYDAADNTTMNFTSGYLTTWADKSGKGRNLSRTHAQYGNITVTLGNLNGKNTVKLITENGLQHTLANPNDIVGNDYHLFAVFRYTINRNYARLFTIVKTSVSDYGNPNANMLILTTSGVGCYSCAAFTPVALNTWTIFQSGQNKTTGYSVRKDGGTGVGGSVHPGFPVGDGTTLNIRLGKSFDNSWDGDAAEFIGIRDPSNDTRLKMEGYLAHKWGLTANLPTDHPYKNTAPTT